MAKADLLRPAGHQYSFDAIGYFLRFVLTAATSLRGASACLGLVRNLLSCARTPTANTGQAWLLRVGLYELRRPKEQADDWVWIIDHTVQLGATKCLLIVGVRLSDWERKGRCPLTHQDLTLLALEPVETSDGPTVQRQLEQAMPQTGAPRAILSDGGSDLKSGVALFRLDHPETSHVQDIAHKAALIVKRELGADAGWERYVKKAGRFKQQVKQTSLACLLPPSPRLKARYMNVSELVTWGGKALRYLLSSQSGDEHGMELPKLREKLGWIAGYREPLQEWNNLMEVVAAALEFVRHEGYHSQAAEQLRQRLNAVATHPMACRAAEALVQVVTEQSAHAREGERLLGSSEILESLIGKGKRLEGQQSQNGFTKMVLGMAAAVATPTRAYLAQALSQIKTKHVSEWCQTHFGLSLQTQRHRALGSFAGTKPG